MTLWLKVAVSLGLMVVLLIVLPWTEVIAALRQLPPGQWVLVLGGFLVGHSLGVVKWSRFVSTNRARLSPRDAVRCYAAGLFANLCLPSIVGGDILRMVLAGRITKHPEAALWGSVMDRTTDIMALAILLLVGGVAVRSALDGPTGLVLGGGLVVALVVGGVAFLIVARTRIRRWPHRLRRPVGRSLVAFRRLLRSPGLALLGLVISLTIQTSFVLLNAWMGGALGIHVALGIWFFAWPLAKLASLIPISLGGLAVREASLAGLLAPFGVPFGIAVLASLLWQSILIAGGLLSGLLWVVLNRRAAEPLALRSATTLTPGGSRG